eukprot:m.38121 g.38121  ORF g.38121 m.38121 type:complete len:462 (+) comp9391_c0_seq2:271-1656(+)
MFYHVKKALALTLLLVVTFLLFPLTQSCDTDLDCSLNGACTNGVCKCDAGWSNGAHMSCELLNLKPANLSHGYNHLSLHKHDNYSVSSWGATQIYNDEDKLYHTFVGEMIGNCGINGYETNEQIVHTTSKTRFGPWKRDGPVHPFASSAVCPHAVRAPDGTWLIFHTGCGNHSDPNSEGYGTNHSLPITNCVNGTTPAHPKYGPHNHELLSKQTQNPTCGVASDITSVFASKTPFGPWTQTRLKTKNAKVKVINGTAWPGCHSHLDPSLCDVPDFIGGNPTPIILENGTTLVLFRAYNSNVTQCKRLGIVIRPSPPNQYPGCTMIGLARAAQWDAEYEIIGGPIVAFQQEDPHIYKTKRGFHAVFHGMDPWPSQVHVGRHAYSIDGINWHGGDVDAWNGTVEIVVNNGKSTKAIELLRRERPELLHDESGNPVALINGAQFGPDPGNPGDQTFTLIQQVGP